MSTSIEARHATSVRPAVRADISFIEEIYELVEGTGAPRWRTDGSTPSPYTTNWIAVYFDRSPADQAIHVAIDHEGQLLGYSWVLILTDFDANIPHGHIAGVGVAPHTEGKGVGSTLVHAAESWCRDQGLAEITLHCYMANERAHGLYGRLGFEDEWYHMRKGLS